MYEGRFLQSDHAWVMYKAAKIRPVCLLLEGGGKNKYLDSHALCLPGETPHEIALGPEMHTRTIVLPQIILLKCTEEIIVGHSGKLGRYSGP